MTSDDRPCFAAALARLVAVFNQPMSEARGEAYFEALADFPIEAVEDAVDRAIETERYFPVPSVLRDWARGRDPRLMDAARKRGWNPEAPGFLPGYDGYGPGAVSARPSDERLSLPAPCRAQLATREVPQDIRALIDQVLGKIEAQDAPTPEQIAAREATKAKLREQARALGVEIKDREPSK